MKNEGSVSVVPLFAPLLLLTFFFVWPSDAPDKTELAHVVLARAMVEHGTFRVNDAVQTAPTTLGIVTVEGDMFTTEAPGLAWLSVPFVGMAKVVSWLRGTELRYPSLLWWLRLVLVQLPAVGFGFWLHAALERRQVSQRASRFAILVLMATWPLLVGAQVLWAEGLAAMWWVVAMTVLSEPDDWPSPQRFGVAGVIVGVALTTTYSLWWLLVPTGIYALSRARQPRWSVAFFVPVGAALALVLGYHTLCYGGPFEFPGLSSLMHWSLSSAYRLWSDPTYGLVWLAPIWLIALLGFAVMLARGEVGVALASLFAALWFAGGANVEGQAPFALVRAALPLVVVLVWPLARATEALGSLFGASTVMGVLAAYSIAIAGLASPYAQFFSRDLVNPLRDISWFVWRDGVVPSGLGHMLGFPADRALWPFWLILALVAFVAGAAGDGSEDGGTWRRRVAVMALGLTAFWGRLATAPLKKTDTTFEAAVQVERQLGGENRFSLRASSAAGSDKGLAEGQSATALGRQQHALDAYKQYLKNR